MPDKTTQRTTPRDTTASDARTLRAAARRYVRRALGKPDDDESHQPRPGKGRKIASSLDQPISPDGLTLQDIVKPLNPPRPVVDWTGIAAFCGFNECETIWFLRTRRDGYDFTELGLTLSQKDSLKRSANRKLSLHRNGLEKFFDFCPDFADLDMSSMRTGPLNETEIKTLRSRFFLKIAQTDNSKERQALFEKLQETRAAGAFDGHIVRQLRESVPYEIQEFFEELSDEHAALRRRDRVIDERMVGDNVVEIWSDLPSIKRRLVAMSRTLQEIQNSLFLAVVTSDDAKRFVKEARAELPEIQFEKIGIKGLIEYEITVKGADGKVRKL